VSPGRSTGLALFSDAGERTDWATDPASAHASAVAEQLGLHVIEPPNLEQLTVVAPPRRQVNNLRTPATAQRSRRTGPRRTT